MGGGNNSVLCAQGSIHNRYIKALKLELAGEENLKQQNFKSAVFCFQHPLFSSAARADESSEAEKISLLKLLTTLNYLHEILVQRQLCTPYALLLRLCVCPWLG